MSNAISSVRQSGGRNDEMTGTGCRGDDRWQAADDGVYRLDDRMDADVEFEREGN